MDFNEAMRQQRAEQERVEAPARRAAAEFPALLAEAQKTWDQAFADMVRYLSSQGVTPRVATWNVTKGGLMSKKHTTPRGYVVELRRPGAYRSTADGYSVIAPDGTLCERSGTYRPFASSGSILFAGHFTFSSSPTCLVRTADGLPGILVRADYADVPTPIPALMANFAQRIIQWHNTPLD